MWASARRATDDLRCHRCATQISFPATVRCVHAPPSRRLIDGAPGNKQERRHDRYAWPGVAPLASRGVPRRIEINAGSYTKHRRQALDLSETGGGFALGWLDLPTVRRQRVREPPFVAALGRTCARGLLEVKWSGREDSNFRPPAPHAGALPGCATPRPSRELYLLDAWRHSSSCRMAMSSCRICSGSKLGAGVTATTVVVLDVARAAARGSAASLSSRWRAPLMVNPCS